MSHIYICYRSIDSHQKAITQLHQRLIERFGVDHVTLSMQNEGYSTTDLQQIVQQHDAMLVIIGRYGLGMVDEAGNLLLADPYDPIHVEIDTALQQRLTIKVLLLDETVSDLSKHLPEVLRPLAHQDVVHVSSNEALSDLTDELMTDLAQVQKRSFAPASKPDLSKMVVQPSRRAHPTSTPSRQAQPDHPTSTVRLKPKQALIMMALIIAIGILLFIVSLFGADTKPATAARSVNSNSYVSDYTFSLTRMAIANSGGRNIQFAPDGYEVIGLEDSQVVVRYDWEDMTAPNRSFTDHIVQQVIYGTGDRLILRDASQLYVINQNDTDLAEPITQWISDDAKIIDMVASQVDPIVVMMLDNGELVMWNYRTDEEYSQEIASADTPLDSPLALSEEEDQVFVMIDQQIHIWLYQTQGYKVFATPYDLPEFVYVQYDDNDDRLIAITEDLTVWMRDQNTNTLSNHGQLFAYENLKQVTNGRLFDFNPQTNRLTLQYFNRTHAWHLTNSTAYLGFQLLSGNVGTIDSIAVSTDGKYLATASERQLILWRFNQGR